MNRILMWSNSSTEVVFSVVPKQKVPSVVANRSEVDSILILAIKDHEQHKNQCWVLKVWELKSWYRGSAGVAIAAAVTFQSETMGERWFFIIFISLLATALFLKRRRMRRRGRKRSRRRSRRRRRSLRGLWESCVVRVQELKQRGLKRRKTIKKRRRPAQ